MCTAVCDAKRERGKLEEEVRAALLGLRSHGLL